MFDFAAVKNRISLETLFREDGHELKRRGGKLVCKSPFNKEKTPSCYIDPARGRFKCFSSGNGGDIFDYVILTRGISIEEAMKVLADRAGVSGQRSEWKPATIKLVESHEEEKSLLPISGEDKAIWEEGVEWLKSNMTACASIAAWRGFSARTVHDLAVQGKIGVPRLNAWLKRQDREVGDRRVAFPVEAVLEDEKHPPLGTAAATLVAYHQRLKPRPGEKKASWRFVPSGVGAWPYVLGDMKDVQFLILCEGQWDAMAMFDALGVCYSEMCLEHVAIVGLRGAQNWRLFMEHYMLADGGEPAHRDLRCMVVCDLDDAGETWATSTGDDPSLVEMLQAICRKVYVREPMEGLGKDLNDVWKAISTAADSTTA